MIQALRTEHAAARFFNPGRITDRTSGAGSVDRRGKSRYNGGKQKSNGLPGALSGRRQAGKGGVMMKQNRNRLTAWLSAVILTAALLALPVYVPAAAEDVVFTQQPQSGVVNIGQPYTFTFETNRPCECMLQMREGSTYDWGNMEIVTYPYTIPDRLIVDEEEKTYYSDVFTVQWKRAENETTLYIEDGTFSDLPLGYGAVEAVPLAVTNTGAYATENLRAYLAEDSSLELIENRTPQAIPAGQTDHETWSVRPRQGLGVGYYQDSVFFAQRGDHHRVLSVYRGGKRRGDRL